MPSLPSPEPTTPPRRRQVDRSATTRAALVAAGRRLFAAEGFAAVATESIVTAAGVSRGALYHQFTDKTALFAAVVEAVEADVAARIADEVAAAGSTDPIEAMRLAAQTWLRICVEPEVHRIVLLDGPSVLGWAEWRELCQRHVFGLVRDVLVWGMEIGRIRRQPVDPLAHVLMGASDEAALYIARAPDTETARTEMINALGLVIDGLTR
ncbi:TetR/AcrR family transcriptional regulator [Frankia sp. AgB1.9]|uniref:TetR/AcrR family transcriptional regulator n=1 Tax=unclassified Frankia TaxID=2632575 RepID=UPI001932FD5D|nr:TetR/AcrR family transcriptional regulator [Frankia sp. AgW1.1]MBL7550390.1 TetR/AcrR family transcriptional regulator [Frankia sp. AgB1.9]MBL7620860.1 TetR/AcrR family transcriptional regulator [Frankia sp. AgB1.8]